MLLTRGSVTLHHERAFLVIELAQFLGPCSTSPHLRERPGTAV
jgi:hypothetical protein